MLRSDRGARAESLAGQDGETVDDDVLFAPAQVYARQSQNCAPSGQAQCRLSFHPCSSNAFAIDRVVIGLPRERHIKALETVARRIAAHCA